MKIEIFDKKEDLYDALAEYYIYEIRNNPKIHLGLATGSTPVPLYERLVKDFKENKTDYKDVKTYNLDEYIGLPDDHKETYKNFMNQNLFDHINIEKNNIHIPKYTDENSLKAYDEILKDGIDIQLLGVGSNGHIGFNEPNTPFDITTHVVRLDEKTRMDNARFFNSIEEVPREAITMGIQNIMDAKAIVLVAVGKNKKEAIQRLLNDEVSEHLPVSVLRYHDDVTIYLDKEAAGDE